MTDPIVAMTAAEIIRLAFGEFVKTTTKETTKSLAGKALAKAGELREKIVRWFRHKQNRKAENAIAVIQQEGDEKSLNKLSTYLDDDMDDFPGLAKDLRELAQQVQHLANQKQIQFGAMTQDVRSGGTGNQFQAETISIGHMGDSIGHQGDIYNNVSDSAETLLSKGMQLLKQGGYSQSIDVLNQAISADPSLVDARYYLAIALLQGKRPKVLTRKVVEAADEAIAGALALVPSNGVFHVFRALIRHDYYEVNGMRSPAPSAMEIMQSIGRYPVDKSQLEQLLTQLSAMKNNPLYASLKSSK